VNTLGELASRRNNNFNLIRMLAATAVLISHSYPLALGPSGVEPLIDLIGLSLGEMAVITFFCISGFFITMSRERAAGNLDYFCARFLRIYPGLTTVLLICAFLIGTTFTTLSVMDYLTDSHTYSYVSGSLSLLGMQFQLPGLFADNPMPGINGSLWTLLYEVLFYVVVGGLGAIHLFTGRRFAWFLIAYALIYLTYKIAALHVPSVAQLTRVHAFFTTSFPFVIGMTLYRYRRNIKLRFLWLLPLLVFAIWSYHQTFFFESLVAAWVYLIFYLGFATTPWLERYNQLGDYSYGVYIYAFPVQEILAHVQKGIGPLNMIIEALPIVVIAAVLSWHLIEKPSMTHRHSVAEQLTSYLNNLRGYWTKQKPPAL
jgi:peptidoglycan/LPS O-acetylase OafA/YrhL